MVSNPDLDTHPLATPTPEWRFPRTKGRRSRIEVDAAEVKVNEQRNSGGEAQSGTYLKLEASLRDVNAFAI